MERSRHLGGVDGDVEVDLFEGTDPLGRIRGEVFDGTHHTGRAEGGGGLGRITTI